VSVAQGIHGSGGRLYDWHALAVVTAVVLKTTPAAPMTVEDIHQSTGIEGRTVRQILSDIDGMDFLLGGTNGYFACEYEDDGESLTHALQSQTFTMQRRLERRLNFGPRLPRRQGRLW
jgi:hypothetical protein